MPDIADYNALYLPAPYNRKSFFGDIRLDELDEVFELVARPEPRLKLSRWLSFTEKIDHLTRPSLRPPLPGIDARERHISAVTLITLIEHGEHTAYQSHRDGAGVAAGTQIDHSPNRPKLVIK